MSRRSLFGRATATAAGITAFGAMAGCENTTTPVAVGLQAGGECGIMGDPTAGGPVDGGGIPLARRDYPVTLPRLGEAVATNAKAERGGELQVYNYADYLNPAVIKEFGRREGVSVRVTTFETLEEAFSKMSTAGLEFDVIFTTPDWLSRLVGRRLLQPLKNDLIPNHGRTVWPEAANPFYDVGPRYTIPYVVYTTGIGWRNDIVRDIDPESLSTIWESLWKATAYSGKVQLLNDPREGIGAAILRSGSIDINTESQELIDQAVAALDQLSEDVRVKVAINAYEAMPAGRTVIGQVWSGDMLNAVISYLPEGVSPEVLSYVFQREGGPVFNDCIGVGAGAQKPVIAHRFLNYLLEEDVALENFVGYVGYLTPITLITAESLIADEVIPPNLATALISRDGYSTGNGFLTLTAEGQRRWDRGWAEFRSG